MNLFLSPHDDDNVLFGAFTCMREHPLVCIIADSYKQPGRGEVGCDAETRAKESFYANKHLGCSIVRLAIRDDIINEPAIKEKLANFHGFDKVYIPALQGGSPHHDMVHRAAKEIFGDKCVEYTTYTKTELWTTGNTEIVPTPEELIRKYEALQYYQSQIRLAATRPHFEAVKGKSEWLI